MKDVTKKIIDMILNMQKQEKKQQREQAENFTSTVGHEMRTPLASILYFIKLLMQMFPGGLAAYPKHQKYFKLVVAQIQLIQTFVDDLLDIRQLKDGVFLLESSVFNLNEVLEELSEIFKHQSHAKGIDLII